MNTADVTALVLAAGKGTRMKSAIPKVMHDMAGKPIVGHVLSALDTLGFTKVCIVVGHGREQVTAYVTGAAANSSGSPVPDIIVQEEQLGTAHAVLQALPSIPDGIVMVVSGDQPLLTPQTLSELLETHKKAGAAATVLTADMEDPTGLGRIVRKNNLIAKIVEQKDADAVTLSIREINTGTYCFQVDELKEALAQVRSDNAQKEYYLTDVFSYFTEIRKVVAGYKLDDPREAMGINDHCQLSAAEDIFWDRTRTHWMREGVKMVCPSGILIEGDVVIEPDVTLLPNTWLKGNTYIKKGSVIGPQTIIKSCRFGENCVVESTVAEESVLGNNCHVGPFGRLRKGTVLQDNVHIGNFVEIKNSTMGKGAKAGHLSYLGDAVLGEDVNIGAGTITCNYDGFNKHKSFLGDRVFVGSNTNLVAPVSVGNDAVIGAGSTITKDVPEGSLAVERAEQKHIKGWHGK
jgi:bifunctional UDP-N-acetylglucosamine pyrophosphorylase/glucosamine-1-phosphate N-acetyltransferase